MTVTCLSICCYFVLRSQTCFVQEHFKRHIFLLQKMKTEMLLQLSVCSSLAAYRILQLLAEAKCVSQRLFPLCMWRENPAQNCSCFTPATALSPEITLEKAEIGVPCLPAELTTQIALYLHFPPFCSFPGSCRDDSKHLFSTLTLWSSVVYLKTKLTCNSLQALMKLEHINTN